VSCSYMLEMTGKCEALETKGKCAIGEMS
jgi:hypothetical protein